jgi:hypothetical protein
MVSKINDIQHVSGKEKVAYLYDARGEASPDPLVEDSSSSRDHYRLESGQRNIQQYTV